MSENKTRPTGASVTAFLESVDNPARREDAFALAELMQRVTGVQPTMWGPAIVGFGSYHYRYDSGREGEMLRVGFSPRKANLALYMTAKDERYHELLSRLGRHRTGGSCLYVNRLADVDIAVLENLVAQSWEVARERYGENSD